MDKCLKPISPHVLNSTWLLDFVAVVVVVFPPKTKIRRKKKCIQK